MCGLLFHAANDALSDESRRNFERGLKLLRHRGPDGTGIAAANGALLGHQRLSIIDIGGGVQPMSDPSRSRHLIFNGEIYNYRDLRRQLGSTWQFRTDSDTEVLLAGLCTEGVDFLSRADGMWAFVFWDDRSRSLLAARDRMGEKPLFYVQPTTDELSFASELPALRKITPGRSWVEDPDSTADYFRYGFALPGHTAFKGVHEVPAAHALTWQSHKPAQITRYWSPKVERFHGTRADAEERIRDLLERSVQRRLVADVEVGALLSGGLDSSIVSTIAADKLARPLRTFSASFQNSTFDESAQAKRVADRIGSHHVARRVTEDMLQEFDETLCRHVGQPFADPSTLPTAAVTKLASESVKVALGGDGADELFCGYERYRATRLLGWYRRLPGPVRRAIRWSIGKVREPLHHHSGSLLKRAHLFVRAEQSGLSVDQYVAPTLFSTAQIERIRPDLSGRGHQHPVVDWAVDQDEARQMMCQDLVTYLSQDILAKVDRASMASSLEVRSPFLCHELVEFALQLPSDWLGGALGGKKILRHAYANRLSSETLGRRKQGFAVPVGEWFKGQLGADLRARLARQDTGLSTACVLQLLDEHVNGHRDHGLQLWAIRCYLASAGSST
ncbi:MAG: asparagine synthase (glutamine-hydrolyzing) [Rhodanobacteraceae bacterium]|nr:asparagine synthase (glutamine-hydrolyzing) [Rhodanobacteraceae bacterium]